MSAVWRPDPARELHEPRLTLLPGVSAALTVMEIPSDLAGPPPADTPVPGFLDAALESFGLGRAQLSPVWRNGAGGLTFSVASAGEASPIDYYVKWNPAAAGESLAAEAERLCWIAGRHPAPAAIELVTNAHEEVLLTRALPGESAVSRRWKHEPEVALRALGVGLRQLHSVALDQWPADWNVTHPRGVEDADASDPDGAPSIDRLVLCQGDPCAPNTLLAADGSFLAHVDLARLGVADRWSDLAVMSMSLAWNFTDYDESVFWEAYGIEPDSRRIDYHRRRHNA